MRWAECEPGPLTCRPGLGLIWALLAVGCAPADGPVFAWQGGVAQAPANSRTAVGATLGTPDVGLHADVFLTADHQPVLWAAPQLDPEICTTADGEPVPEDTWLVQLALADLQAEYRCGGTPDPRFPDAQTRAAPVLSMDELLDLLEGFGDTPVVLSAHTVPNVSHAPEVYAAEILERWWAAGAPQDLIIAADLPSTIAAFEDRAQAQGVDLETRLIWPRVPPQGAAWLADLGTASAGAAGLDTAIVDLEAAGADGLLLRAAAADRGLVRALEARQIPALVGPVRTRLGTRQSQRWPVEGVLSAWAPDP